MFLIRNPLNDVIMDKEIKIEKVGYRTRILNKLRTGKEFKVIIYIYILFLHKIHIIFLFYLFRRENIHRKTKRFKRK